MKEQRIRDLFADELGLFGEHSLAARVRNGSDNSFAGQAAVAAMKKIAREVELEVSTDVSET